MLTRLEKKPFALSLQGTRMELLRADVRYAELLWDCVLRDRETRGISWPSMETIDDLKDFLTEVSGDLPDREVVYLIFKIDKIIGTIHLHSLNYRDHKLELGYAIEKSHEGQGYITEAIPLAEAEAKRLGFHRIELTCNTTNTRSLKVAERMNYIHEGTKIQDCIENGKFRDTALFAKILN